MSTLGSVGSSDVVAQAQIASPVTVEVSEDDLKTSQLMSIITELLTSSEQVNVVRAMELIIDLMAKGVNVSEFCPLVVQHITSKHPTIRHLAYVYLDRNAEQASEGVMLSINTFQKSLTDADSMVRAFSMKVMSGMKQTEMLPTVYDAISQVIGDTSPYVKKAAAYAMIKSCELDPDEIERYMPLIERLLSETDPIAFGGAIAAYWSLCPDNIELLHPHFRRICQTVRKLDPYSQVFVLRAMTIYARYCFRSPVDDEVGEGAAAFWDENPEKESLSSDHSLLIGVAKRLLQSPSSAVVMAAVALLVYCAPGQQLSVVAKPLVRLIYENATTAEISLKTVLTIAVQNPHIFISHMTHFYVRRRDSVHVKQLKVKILAALTTPSNAELILNELASYIGSSDGAFAATAVRTMGMTAAKNEGIIPVCLVVLLRLMGRSDGQVLAEVVVAISTLLRKRRGTEDEAQALHHLCRKFIVIKSSAARAAVLSIVGDMHETHPEFAPQLLRYIGQNFAQENIEVRLQALTLAAKLVAAGVESGVPMYLLRVSERETDFDVRDRARLLVALLGAENDKIKENLKELLCPTRELPTWSDIDSGASEFQIGSFSHVVGHEVGGYEALPEWVDESELPDDSCRLQTCVMPDGTIAPVTAAEDSDSENIELDDFFDVDGKKGAAEGENEYYSDDPEHMDAAADAEDGDYYDDDADASPVSPPASRPRPTGDDSDLDDFFN